MNNIYAAGNKGPEVRSDCYVAIDTSYADGLKIELNSKVKKLFGKSIIKLATEVLEYFGIKKAHVVIEDRGALPFVIAARIEAAIKQFTNTQKEYLLPMLDENTYTTKPDRYRRSRLYLPGNTPKLMINAGIHKADGIILDLEDSVAPAKKDEARILVRNALRQIDFYGVERMVRINQIPRGLDDLEMIIPHNVNVVLVPKAETPEQIKEVVNKILQVSKDKNVYLMPIIESALGVENAYKIATASDRVIALAIGLEDYTADLGTQRTAVGTETFVARCRLVNAARAAGVQAIDSVFSDVGNMEALKNVVTESKSLGFEGMGCIHPRQIKVIHANYAPADKEIKKAKKIVLAFDEATAKGLGVVSLGSKMIDPPVVKRAIKTIDLAVQSGLLAKDWKEIKGEEA